MSRLEKVIKNIAASYASQIISAIVAFLCRTVFIRQLGAVYLGVNGLFLNILGLLALAELGFGTAMNFEMYKPVAQGDYKKINTLLTLYKQVYHGMALFIAIAGLLIIPFIPYLVKDPGYVGNIYIYYFIYLANTVVGYYASYLLCLTNAEQKEYVSSIISIIVIVFNNIVQIIVLIMYQSFLAYLIMWSISLILQQIIIKLYFQRNYRQVFNAGIEKLDDETCNHIKKNMGGLIVSKLSDVMTHQTDNIIVAIGIDIVTVGCADNYNMIMNYLKKIILALLTSVVPSMGNMVATEDRDKCYRIFKVYDMVDYFIYSFCTICMVVLFQPFIVLWAGQDKIIDFWSMIALCASFYISGRNHAFLNYKTAFGIFYDIKITSIVSVILNLCISIAGVYYFGLVGVYIGTCVSFLYSNIRILRLSYESMTGKSVKVYFLKRLNQAITTVMLILILGEVSIFFSPSTGWGNLLLYAVVVAISALVILSLINIKHDEYKSMVRIVLYVLKKLGKR